MPSSFMVTFKNEEDFIVTDIIDFEPYQVLQIQQIAADDTRQGLMAQRYGTDIKGITTDQEQDVIRKKNTITSQGDSRYLYDNEIVLFGSHSFDRMATATGASTLVEIIEGRYDNSVQGGNHDDG